MRCPSTPRPHRDHHIAYSTGRRNSSVLWRHQEVGGRKEVRRRPRLWRRQARRPGQRQPLLHLRRRRRDHHVDGQRDHPRGEQDDAQEHRQGHPEENAQEEDQGCASSPLACCPPAIAPPPQHRPVTLHLGNGGGGGRADHTARRASALRRTAPACVLKTLPCALWPRTGRSHRRRQGQGSRSRG